MKRTLVIVVGLIASLLGGVGLSVLSPSVASATPRPCTIPGNDPSSGWFWAGDRVYNCSIDGNHVVMDRYSTSGLEEQGAVDWWQPNWLGFGIAPSAPNVSTGAAYIRFCSIAQVSPKNVDWVAGPGGRWHSAWIHYPSSWVEGAFYTNSAFATLYNSNFGQIAAGCGTAGAHDPNSNPAVVELHSGPCPAWVKCI